MPFTQADIDALKAAIAAARGGQKIRYDNQEYTSHSVGDLEKLLGLMQNDVAAQAAASGDSTTRFAATSKGI